MAFGSEVDGSAASPLPLRFVIDDGTVYEAGRLFPTQDGCGMWRPRRVTECISGARSEQEDQQNTSVSDQWEGRRRIVAVAAGHFAAYVLDGEFRQFVFENHAIDHSS